MKKLIGILILLLTISCSSDADKRVIGTWHTQSKYYQGTFKIEEKNDKMIAKVLYYNDGTTILKETGTEQDVFVNDLKYKNKQYVDAVSGATATYKIAITVVHKDTLSVTNYIQGQPLQELWTRKTN